MTTRAAGAQRPEEPKPPESSPKRGNPLPVLQGVLPLRASRVPTDLLAGVTLAALGIPEVLGYAKIAGMPVVTGLYTILLPMAVFALLGSSRHLVVGADSATAAILAAGLAGVAGVVAGSPRYVSLAGLAALLTGGLLLLARVIRLGFLANFLSRTVLVGFLTGVGVQVAAGQVGEMLGVGGSGHGTIGKLSEVARHIRGTDPATVVVSAAVIVLVLGIRHLTHRVPGALIAVVGGIAASRYGHLQAYGVRILGPVPRGLPHVALPAFSITAATALIGTAVSMFVVVLAQSSATSRAYAARYGESFDENTDLVGLGAANLAAGVTGTFVVNGSPTKTEMVDGAGGRSQLSQLTTCVVVLVVLLFLTGWLAYLPLAALATIVFLIGVELVDVRSMRRILAVRRGEFVVALLTVAAVVLVGVEQAIIFAILASIIDHLRHSYDPRSTVLVPTSDGHWQSTPARPGTRTAGGLLIYRFGSGLYYAKAHELFTDVTGFLEDGQSLSVFCLDAVAVGDIDFTAGAALRRVHEKLHARGVKLVFCEVAEPVRRELDRYGVSDLVGSTAYYRALVDVLAAFAPSGTGGGPGGERAKT